MLFLLSGPSGVGKGTVRKALFDNNNLNLKYSISATTREKREGEVDGVDYFFMSRDEFEALIKNNRMLEYASYADNYYGTPKDWIDQTLADGDDVFMEIEVQGAMQVRELVDDAIFIFLTPPDLQTLKNRLELRGTETSLVIDKRLVEAKREIDMMSEYDYVVVNDKVDLAVDRIEQIINVHRMNSKRVAQKYKKMLED